MLRRARKNIYEHEIDLTDLRIKNAPREAFRKQLEKIKYKGYEVEQISDGRKVVVTKPGGKFSFGTIRREDFMVWIYNPADKTLWLISHKNILEDLQNKGEVKPEETIEIIGALERVYNGEEPDEVLSATNLRSPVGEIPEVLLKVYKWIGGQEDSNSPDGKGRAMSWEGWGKVDDEWRRTGNGITDLRERLRRSSGKSTLTPDD